LGNGTFDDNVTPGQVPGIDHVTSTACGANHTLVLKNDGTVWAWGQNNHGQLGDGTTIERDFPFQVTDISDVAGIACGANYTLALKNDGTVWAWGQNNYGQLGDGTVITRKTPVQISSISNISAIACGGQHALAVDNDGTILAWGNNQYGQLGFVNTAEPYLFTPVYILNLHDMVMVSCGEYFSTALNKNGMVWAWGENRFGQLGDGTMTNRANPVQVLGEDGQGYLNLRRDSKTTDIR